MKAHFFLMLLLYILLNYSMLTQGTEFPTGHQHCFLLPHIHPFQISALSPWAFKILDFLFMILFMVFSLNIFTYYRCLVTQSCQTPCDAMDFSPPSSSVHGIFQARILERVAISFFRRPSWPRDQTLVSVSPALQMDSLLLSHWGSS